MNSRRKGKDGELEVVKILKNYGIPARRGQQFKGTKDSPDVIIDWPDWWVGTKFTIEVKRRASLNVRAAVERARLDAPEGEVGIVWHRPNDCSWHMAGHAGELFMELCSLNSQLADAYAEIDRLKGDRKEM